MLTMNQRVELKRKIRRCIKHYLRFEKQQLTPFGEKAIEELMERELRAFEALPRMLLAFAKEQENEVRILTDRLCRRFDLGMALNEAAQRAQARMAELKQDYPQYTDLQYQSLIGQEAMLMRAVRNTPAKKSTT